MKHRLATSLAAACVLVGTAFGGDSAVGEAPGGGGEDAVFRAVIHVNFDDSERQKAALKNVTNMLDEVKSGDIEVVCHGKGLGLLVREKTQHAAEVERLAKRGVRFAACENTMREKSVANDQLLSGVSTVPSGAVEIVRKQQQGYGYFRP
jgi:intracellular sulfur oxidation DsrE/DsrF family protein